MKSFRENGLRFNLKGFVFPKLTPPQIRDLFAKNKQNHEVRHGHEVKDAGVQAAGHGFWVVFQGGFSGFFAHGALRGKIHGADQ